MWLREKEAATAVEAWKIQVSALQVVHFPEQVIVARKGGACFEGSQLIGHDGTNFKTTAAAAWPPLLCRWVADSILLTFLNRGQGEGEVQVQGSKRKRQEEKDAEKKEDREEEHTPHSTGEKDQPANVSGRARRFPTMMEAAYGLRAGGTMNAGEV